MASNMKHLAIAAILLLPGPVWAESLFEEAETATDSAPAVNDEKGGANLSLSVNGYLKGGIFAGRNEAADATLQGMYGEFDVKCGVEKSEFGRALVEIRDSAGNVRGPESGTTPDIREAWVETSAGPVTARLGRQIIVWGRADSINPTNNITPMNSVVLSSEYDDTRMGNELLQLRAKLSPEVSLTGIWVPQYRPDVLPFDGVTLPSSVQVGSTVYPDDKLSNSSYAARLEVTTSPIDGSLSYYQGYETLPGFDHELTSSGIALIPTAYRMKAVGADFSMAAGDFGLRGEACMKMPDLSNDDYPYVPASRAEYVVGIDRTLGDWNALVQYSGVYIPNFREIPEPVLTGPGDPQAQMAYAAQKADAEMAKLNRLFTGTADRVSHAVTGQIGWTGMADTLHLKLAGIYNFTTRDFVINPSASYDVADAMTVTVGARDIDGPDGSINRLVNRLMSSVYAEVKCSF